MQLFSMTIDGCLSMLGTNQELQRLISKWRAKDNLLRAAWHYCNLHQESLLVKSLKKFHVTKLVTTIVKWIRVNALKHYKFETFFLDNDADYVDVFVFTFVKWLSRSACLKNSITFFRRLRCCGKKIEREKDISQLDNKAWTNDLAFMINIANNFSLLICVLLGNNKFCQPLIKNCVFVGRS